MDRHVAAFGYGTVAPQVFGAALKLLPYFFRLPSYRPADSRFAEMYFVNRETGDTYAWGVDMIESGIPALPFVPQRPTIRRFLAPPPMVSFTRDKHVVVTPIDRSRHEMIENFGNRAYRISMQGILVDVADHQYPGDLVREVHGIFDNPGVYKAVGDIFDDLSINDIFFESAFKVDFVEGYVDTVKWSVNAISVESAEFDIT
jgi:hypothetical protein